MKDYQPLDISNSCNAGMEILPKGEVVPLGLQTLRGLPFLVGPRKGNRRSRCFIALDGTQKSVTVRVNQSVYTVVVAHRLLQPGLAEERPLDTQVGDYVFYLSNGHKVSVPIRQRYDIAMVGDPDIPGEPGQSIPALIREHSSTTVEAALARGELLREMAGRPVRAVVDQNTSLVSRNEGPWDQFLSRQREVTDWKARHFYLWAWKNPELDSLIEAIEIVPQGPPFIVAGVTLGQVDEYPFTREGRRPVRILMMDPVNAKKPFDLDVDVNRGDTTHVYPLPEASEQQFLKDHYKGWGEMQNVYSSPAYLEISAIPSATVTVKQGDKEVGKVNWGEVEQNGAAETANVRLELLDRGKNWVHVTVLDDDTGKPVPCRIHFRSPEGVPYQPYGHPNHVNSNLGSYHIDIGGDVRLGQITYAYIDGTCQGWLPRGEVIVDVARGYEYEPLRTKVRIEPGQRELTLGLKRWINMNSLRWFSGDSHVHFLSTQGAHFESQGEDLNVVNLLQSQWGSLFTNTEDFTGAPSVSQNGTNIVYVSQENRQHYMGHMLLWGLKRPIMPWCSGGFPEAEVAGTLEVTMADWADQCHAQGGHVISAHFPNPNGEQAALIASGRIDGVEMIRQSEFNHREYYRYLNCGYKLPLVGGTDKMSSDVAIGSFRTYGYIPEDEEFDYDNWCRSVAQGRSFLSAGPIIHFTVDGHTIGDTIQMVGRGTVEVEAWAESIFPIHTLEIVQAGKVVASAESKIGSRRLEIKEKLKMDGHTWLAARCGGPKYFQRREHGGWIRGVFAHTSPIYIACGTEWWMFNKETAHYMLTLIESDLVYIREMSRQYPPGSVTHHHGEEDHLGYLERPFLEARQIIQKRMHMFDSAH